MSARGAAEAEGDRLVFGVNPVLEALRARPGEIDRLYLADGQLAKGPSAEIRSRADKARIRVERASRERLASMTGSGAHQGVAARVRTFRYVELDDLLDAAKASGRPPLVVVLDGIQDPHNLGAIIRSAHALGAHGVVLPKDRASAVTGTVAKTSAGAVEHCPIAQVVNVSRALETLKAAGLWVAAADPKGDRVLWDAPLDGPLALVVGSEGKGIREGVLAHCDFRLRVPMAEKWDSLNASVSCALMLYEALRHREKVAERDGA